MNDQELFSLWDKARRSMVLELPVQITAGQLHELATQVIHYRQIMARMKSNYRSESHLHIRPIQSELILPPSH